MCSEAFGVSESAVHLGHQTHGLLGSIVSQHQPGGSGSRVSGARSQQGHTNGLSVCFFATLHSSGGIGSTTSSHNPEQVARANDCPAGVIGRSRVIWWAVMAQLDVERRFAFEHFHGLLVNGPLSLAPFVPMVRKRNGAGIQCSEHHRQLLA